MIGSPMRDSGPLLTEVDVGCKTIDLLHHLNDNREGRYFAIRKS